MNAFERLLEAARVDDDVLAVILSGSRGRGMGAPDSDWDCCLVLRDGSDGDSVRPTLNDPEIDASIFTLSDLGTHAAPGSPDAWNAYSFVHVTVAYDSTSGAIRQIAAKKEFLNPSDARARTASELDAFINGAVRAAKSRRDGLPDLAALDTAESIAPALETFFALGGRIRPYDRYLRWELDRHPLELQTTATLPELVVAVARAEEGAPERLFGEVETAARAKGFGGVLDAWDPPSLALARR